MCIHTYIHTYIHTHRYIYIYVCVSAYDGFAALKMVGISCAGILLNGTLLREAIGMRTDDVYQCLLVP